MRAAWKVKTAEEGEKRLEQLARFLEREYESAARSLREGMQEMFTLQRLQIPESCTNVWPPPTSSKVHRAGWSAAQHNVTRWRDAGHGAALGGFGVAAYRKAFPTDRRPCEPLGTGRHSRTGGQVNNSIFEGENSVR